MSPPTPRPATYGEGTTLEALFASEYGERSAYTEKELRVLDRRIADLAVLPTRYSGWMD